MSNTISAEEMLKGWLIAARKVTAVPCENTMEDEEIIRKMGLTKASLLGCICLNIGYLLCGENNIRILGGRNRFCDSLIHINEIDKGFSILKNVLVVADTAEGGLFAVNCSDETGAEKGELLYLPPESLIWEPLELSYAAFVMWALESSKADLLQGGWIEKPSGKIDLMTMDRKTNAKIAMLKSMG